MGQAAISIVGGGVAGLLSAYLLAEVGCRVSLYERSECGGESSWAGGGIISPLYPWRYNSAVWALARNSKESYAVLSASLSKSVGVDIELYSTGLYWLDLEDSIRALAWAADERLSLSALGRDDLVLALSMVASSYSAGLHMRGVANVRNPYLLQALRSFLRATPNVCLYENSQVERLVSVGGRISGVVVDNQFVASDQVLLAAGAWSGELLATLGLHLPVEPVKGQMILYKCEPDYLPAMVLAEGRYAIPRRDGHVLVGSTLEHVGFDKTPTGEALASLQASAEKMLPGLAQREVVGHWAGLRPGSPDGIPFIGEVPELPGLWLNCGHYRNGLVLAPASCELLKNLMLGETPIVDPAPYSPVGRLKAL